MFRKIAILCSLAAFVLPVLRSQEPDTPSSTSPSQSGAAPPPTGQSAPPAQAPSSSAPPSVSPPQNPPPAAPLPEAPEKPVLKRTKKKTPATHTPSGKVVVKNGGVKDDSEELAPGMTKEQAQHSRESTTQLLASTDQNLKNVVGRQFSPAQQNMLEEIHTYVRQSKGATDSGDLARAHTLAYKALQLSGELAKK